MLLYDFDTFKCYNSVRLTVLGKRLDVKYSYKIQWSINGWVPFICTTRICSLSFSVYILLEIKKYPSGNYNEC